MKILIIYSSTDGHTKKICEVIKENLINKGELHLTSIENVSETNVQFYDYIIIGASIRYGKHNRKVFDFIEKNLNIIEKKKNAFFSVNVVARKNEKNTPETNPYIKKFLSKTRWKPKKLGVFAGKVDYPSYRFFDKYIIKFIMWLTKGPTDVSKSYEFTNWSEVEKFGEKINKM